MLRLLGALLVARSLACPHGLFDATTVEITCGSNTPENCWPGVGCLERDIVETWCLETATGLSIDVPACPQRHLALNTSAPRPLWGG
jgi:hypothetical protein